jgi:hypothetical protein
MKNSIKIKKYLDTILHEDGHKLSNGSLKTIQMIKIEVENSFNNSDLKCDCGETKDIRMVAICPCCYNPNTCEW